VLLSSDGYRGNVVETASSRDCVVRGRLPCCWVDFGAGGMRRTAVADYLASIGIAYDHFA
jgi:hypothetical protein